MSKSTLMRNGGVAYERLRMASPTLMPFAMPPRGGGGTSDDDSNTVYDSTATNDDNNDDDDKNHHHPGIGNDYEYRVKVEIKDSRTDLASQNGKKIENGQK